MIAGSVLLIVAALYCLFCHQVENNKIWKNAVINGVSVKGMTLKEAKEALTEEFQESYKDAALTVSYGGEEYKVNVSSVLGFDSSAELKKEYSLGHRGWLLQGIDWILARTAYKDAEEITAYPHAQSTENIAAALTESGIPERDPASETTWEVTDTALVIHKGAEKDGADLEKLQELITDAIETHDYSSVIECPLTLKTPGEVDFQAIYDEVYQKKKNATLNKKKDYAVVSSQKGISFDVDKAKEQYEACGYGEDLEIKLDIEEPDITTEDLKNNLFTTELGSYSTNGGGTSGRINNISLAVKSCNGTILLPGETFSYNDTLGERTAERGYQAAGAYSDGEVVEQLGGGICQVSSTLFSALLHTKLEIVTRSNHSMPVSYLPLGMDAAVSWGAPDLKFKNNLDYPIKLSATYSGGTITFKILGAKSDKQKIEVEVKQTGELSAETYRKYYDSDGNLTDTKRVCTSNYKPLNSN